MTDPPRLPTARIREAMDLRRPEEAWRSMLLTERRSRVLAEEAAAAREDVLAVVSHDLQNLLNAIGLNLAVLVRTPVATEAERRMQHCGEIMERSVGAMNRLLRDILDAQRVDAVQIVTAREDLVEVVRDAVELMLPLAAQKGVAIEVHASREREDALFERERIGQVLHNLLGNAIHFTPAHKTIVVRVERFGGEVSVAVADRGQGIPEEQRAQAFERYWRGRGASRQGVGLGLFIVRSLIDAHRGRIVVEETPGGGATFAFTLPAAQHAATGSRG